MIFQGRLYILTDWFPGWLLFYISRWINTRMICQVGSREVYIHTIAYGICSKYVLNVVIWCCNEGRFHATEFLEKLRNQRMVFVGDSLNRGQWSSMVCLVESAIPSSSLKSLTYNGSLTIFKATVLHLLSFISLILSSLLPTMVLRWMEVFTVLFVYLCNGRNITQPSNTTGSPFWWNPMEMIRFVIGW